MSTREEKTVSLKSQSVWLLFAKLVGFGFAFILPLVVVRVLSKEEFGVYRLSFLIMMNAVAIFPFGIAMSAYYYLARDVERRASAVLNIMLVHFIAGAIAFVILFFFPGAIGSITGSTEIEKLSPLIAASVWIWLFSVFLEHAAVANREPKTATLFIVFAQFSKTALMCCFVLWLRTVESILYAAILQGIIQTLILLVYLAKKFPGFWTKFDAGFLKEHLIYAVPFGFAGILWTMQVDLHYYFVTYRYGEVLYAIYTVGCFQLPLIALLSESINSVLIPRMSELQMAEDHAEMIRLKARAMQKLAFAYFPLYIFLMITSETLITTLFTEKYIESVPVFMIFLTMLPFQILISDPIVRAYEELGRFLLKLRIATFVVLVVSLYLGITYLSILGIIAIVVGVRTTELLLVEAIVLKKIGARASDLRLLAGVGKTAILSILCGIGTFFFYSTVKEPLGAFISQNNSGFLRGINENILDFVSGVFVLGVTCIVFAAAYFVGSYLIGTIEDSEKEHVRSLLRNTYARIKR